MEVLNQTSQSLTSPSPAPSNPYRPLRLCQTCGKNRSAISRPPHRQLLCQECFLSAFERDVYEVIVSQRLFTRGEKVAIGVSGGKDSSVLAYVMHTLNERHNMGLELFLLAIDEGISGYRDDALETVKRNEQRLQLPLTICSYQKLYGWTMDEIVRRTGKKNNCTFCGVFRRQALERGAAFLKVNKLSTGHNADDVAETVLMNFLRGDINRLNRCADALTGGDTNPAENEVSAAAMESSNSGWNLPRCKPLIYCYEKEIVLYAHFKGLEYFSTECIYSPNAYRGYARDFIKQIELCNPMYILQIIHSAQQVQQKRSASFPPGHSNLQKCCRCGFMSSNTVCKACILLEGLEKGNYSIARTRTKKKIPTLTPCYEKA
ncbi:PP-loop family protein [Cardiosporidium cionae]|uniref:Cytoplasmic tRNA 2-thiolation protein 1 n=1 Tax=Cardiosporidium cionae TaxID=476202 RepID=A0ABQ7J4P3_9APIC|nr:PP-loop family protein [Cardiosporidium cionae]|eukprot:KAF8818157.1 PP-loop family protein [Cardiosporidium cionae]